MLARISTRAHVYTYRTAWKIQYSTGMWLEQRSSCWAQLTLRSSSMEPPTESICSLAQAWARASENSQGASLATSEEGRRPLTSNQIGQALKMLGFQGNRGNQHRSAAVRALPVSSQTTLLDALEFQSCQLMDSYHFKANAGVQLS